MAREVGASVFSVRDWVRLADETSSERPMTPHEVLYLAVVLDVGTRNWIDACIFGLRFQAQTSGFQKIAS